MTKTLMQWVLSRSSNLSCPGLEEFLLQLVLGMLRGNALLVVQEMAPYRLLIFMA